MDENAIAFYAPKGILDPLSIWCCRISGFISLISSALLLWLVGLLSTTGPKNNILRGLSCMDVLQSIAYVASSAPSHSGTWYGSIGNSTTCKIQGFLVQIGMGVPLYSASLALFYLLAIGKNYSIDKFSRRIEPFCHIVSIGMPLVTAIVMVCFNKVGQLWTGLCWAFSSHQPKDTIMTAFLFGGISILLCNTFVLYSVISISIQIRSQSRRIARYNHSGQAPAHLVKMHRESLVQGLLYFLAYFFTYFPSLLVVLFSAMDIDDDKHLFSSILTLIQNIFLPLHGLWNLIIYSHPYLRRMKARDQSLKTLATLWFLYTKPTEFRQRLTTGTSAARRASIPRIRDVNTASILPSQYQQQKHTLSTTHDDPPDITQVTTHNNTFSDLEQPPEQIITSENSI